jgi:hypothetical protein
MKRQQWLVFVPVTLATAGLAACASVMGGEEVKVRSVDTMQTLTTAPRDALYESAVSAINERDYGRALEYLQAAKAKDPRNVKALNALGVVYDKLGRFDLSARYYAQARAIEPDSRIVAENLGYSRVLQRLLNPNQPVAVATIDLPPGLTSPASAQASSDKAVVTAELVPAEPVLPVREKRVIDTPPPTVTAVPIELPDARYTFADISLPEPPVTERKLIDAPHPTVTAMLVELPDAKHIFADVSLPEPVMPVMEKKVIDAPFPILTAAPFVLPDTKPFFASAVLSLPVPGTENRTPAEPVTSAATMTAALSPATSAAAAPLSAAPEALVISAVERKLRFERPAIAVAAPVLAAVSISLPLAEARTVPVPAVLAVTKPMPVAPAVGKPIASASVAAPQAVPARAVAPAVLVKQAAKATPAKGKVLTIGQPIRLVDASGKPGGAGAVLRRLTSLGWTMRAADSRIQPATVLFYPVQNLAAAKAMQRTLPFPVRLIAESGKASGMRLVIGRDYLAWKPRNSRIAVLWQKRMVIASSQKMSLRGVR